MLVDLEAFGKNLASRGVPQGTYRTYMSVLRQWSCFLNGKLPTRMTARDFIDHKIAQGRTNSTVYCYVVILEGYFDWRGDPVDLGYPEIIQAKIEYSREYYRKNYIGTDSKSKPIWAPNKRPRPDVCELCGAAGKLDYHHWNEEDLSKGLWLCWKCHGLAEGTDAGASSDKYLELRQQIEVGLNEEIRTT